MVPILAATARGHKLEGALKSGPLLREICKIKVELHFVVQQRTKVHAFSYNATIAKKNITPTPVGPKSNVVPATQHTGPCQRKNADKAAEALH